MRANNNSDLALRDWYSSPVLPEIELGDEHTLGNLITQYARVAEHLHRGMIDGDGPGRPRFTNSATYKLEQIGAVVSRTSVVTKPDKALGATLGFSITRGIEDVIKLNRMETVGSPYSWLTMRFNSLEVRVEDGTQRPIVPYQGSLEFGCNNQYGPSVATLQYGWGAAGARLSAKHLSGKQSAFHLMPDTDEICIADIDEIDGPELINHTEAALRAAQKICAHTDIVTTEQSVKSAVDRGYVHNDPHTHGPRPSSRQRLLDYVHFRRMPNRTESITPEAIIGAAAK